MSTKYLRKYPLALLTACAVVGLSLYPFPEIPRLDDVPLADKWTHMVMYGGLCSVIWAEYLRSHGSVDVARVTVFALLCPIAFGGALELAQEYLTVSRSGDWLDLLADSVGAFMAYIAGMAAARYLGRSSGR